MSHRKHGEGTVTELMPDGRTRISFDNGEEHRYKPESMHKLERGESAKAEAEAEAAEEVEK